MQISYVCLTDVCKPKHQKEEAVHLSEEKKPRKSRNQLQRQQKPTRPVAKKLPPSCSKLADHEQHLKPQPNQPQNHNKHALNVTKNIRNHGIANRTYIYN